MEKDSFSNKTLLIIGKSLEDYSRKWVFIKGFQKHFKTEVVDLKDGPFLSWRFLKEIFRLGWSRDYLMVMQVAQEFVWPLLIYRLLTFYKQKVIIDAHISLYDTFVNDRQLASRFSLKGFYYFVVDFLTCQLGDILIFDTRGHKEYFQKTFKLRPKIKKIVLPVAVDLEAINKKRQEYPGKTVILNKGKFNLVFWGYYIPLQGIECILEAAAKLKEEAQIHFTLIGNGQTKKKMEALKEKLALENVTMINSVEYEDLFNYIFDADLCLGIFGTSGKARRVIPNKLLEAMAAGQSAITGRNADMEEYFENGKQLIFCCLGDAEDLALKIKMAYNWTEEKRRAMGEEAISAIRKNFCLGALEKKIETNLPYF